MRRILSLALLAMAAMGAAGRPASAELLPVQFTGLNLTYDGTNLTSGADPLTSVVFNGGPGYVNPPSTLIGDLTTSFSPFLPGTSAPAGPGTYLLSSPSGDLTIAFNSMTVSILGGGFFAEASATVTASTVSGIAVGTSTVFTLSSLMSNIVKDVDGRVTSFRAIASGEIALVPEPSSVALGAIGVATLGLAGWRRSRRRDG